MKILLNDFQNVEYISQDKRITIQVVSNEKDLYGCWIQKENISLEFHYLKKENKFLFLNGSLGDVIRLSQINDDEKISRVLEALNYGLSEHYKQLKNNNKI